jgi:hypothetical protein
MKPHAIAAALALFSDTLCSLNHRSMLGQPNKRCWDVGKS